MQLRTEDEEEETEWVHEDNLHHTHTFPADVVEKMKWDIVEEEEQEEDSVQ